MHIDLKVKVTLSRSDRFWAGLSSDLVIEQTLTCSVTATGDPTRGRGITEIQRLVWIISMPFTAEANSSVQCLTEARYVTNDQHKESSKSRIERDLKDTKTVLEFLEERNPFSPDTSLRNVVTGVTEAKAVNVDREKETEHRIFDSMTGKEVDECTFKREDQAVTLGKGKLLKVGKDEVQVDPLLFFQRLIAVGISLTDDTSSLFKYELSTVPSALFEPSGLMRRTDKPTLAKSLLNMLDDKNLDLSHNVEYVLDGGALLQQLPWKRGMTYSAICDLYVDYVKSNYKNAVVVFDGYEGGPSTKDTAHLRRTRGCTSTPVKFTEDMTLTLQKDLFLKNK